MAEMPAQGWALLADPVARRVLSSLAKSLVSSAMGLSYELKLEEALVLETLNKLQEAGLVKLEGAQGPNQSGRPRYTLTDLGIKLRSQFLEIDRGQRTA